MQNLWDNPQKQKCSSLPNTYVTDPCNKLPEPVGTSWGRQTERQSILPTWIPPCHHAVYFLKLYFPPSWFFSSSVSVAVGPSMPSFNHQSYQNISFALSCYIQYKQVLTDELPQTKFSCDPWKVMLSTMLLNGFRAYSCLEKRIQSQKNQVMDMFKPR